MEASIIIPTFNRARILKKCLNALSNQTYRNFEVIVVDDGSIDDTKKIISEFEGLKIKYIYQKHSQQGIARNKGIEKAKGKYIVFIGDDIVPEKNWLSEHIRIHKKEKNIAVLGLTIWPKSWRINKFMRYLAPNGPQFNYGKIKDKKNCGWDFFWTSNISLEKKWFMKNKFDENFRGWGYEDLELGYRLIKKGLRIVFNPKAIAYHYHYYKYPEEFLRKQKNAAKSALYFVKKFPEVKEKLIDNNRLKLKYKLLLEFFKLFPFLKNNVFYWKVKRRYYFEKGVKEYENENRPD